MTSSRAASSQAPKAPQAIFSSITQCAAVLHLGRSRQHSGKLQDPEDRWVFLRLKSRQKQNAVNKTFSKIRPRMLFRWLTQVGAWSSRLMEQPSMGMATRWERKTQKPTAIGARTCTPRNLHHEELLAEYIQSECENAAEFRTAAVHSGDLSPHRGPGRHPHAARQWPR